MIKITDIQLTLEQVAHSTNVLLIDCKPVKEFVDGKPTDKIVAYNYVVVAPQNKFANFSVKIEGASSLVSSEQIQSNGGNIEVTFSGFIGRFFRSKTGDYLFTSKATGLEILS